MRNRKQASEEERPGAHVGGRSIRRQDVEQAPRAAALALAEHREAERGGQNSQLDDQDQDQKAMAHLLPPSCSGMNPSMWGSGHQMVRVLTSPKLMKYISLIV